MAVLARLVLDEVVRLQHLADVVEIAADAGQQRIRPDRLGGRLGQRRHGHAVRVRPRRPTDQLLGQRVRAVGQLQQADLGDDAEQPLDDGQQAADEKAGQRPQSNPRPASKVMQPRPLAGVQPRRHGHQGVGDARDKPYLDKPRPRPHALEDQHSGGLAPGRDEEIAEPAALHDDRRERQADRHQQRKLRIVRDGEHDGGRRQRHQKRLPRRPTQQQADRQRQHHQRANAGDPRQALRQPGLKARDIEHHHEGQKIENEEERSAAPDAVREAAAMKIGLALFRQQQRLGLGDHLAARHEQRGSRVLVEDYAAAPLLAGFFALAIGQRLIDDAEGHTGTEVVIADFADAVGVGRPDLQAEHRHDERRQHDDGQPQRHVAPPEVRQDRLFRPRRPPPAIPLAHARQLFGGEHMDDCRFEIADCRLKDERGRFFNLQSQICNQITPSSCGACRPRRPGGSSARGRCGRCRFRRGGRRRCCRCCETAGRHRPARCASPWAGRFA